MLLTDSSEDSLSPILNDLGVSSCDVSSYANFSAYVIKNISHHGAIDVQGIDGVSACSVMASGFCIGMGPLGSAFFITFCANGVQF